MVLKDYYLQRLLIFASLVFLLSCEKDSELNGDNFISSFILFTEDTHYQGKINNTNNTITVIIPFSENITSLVPKIQVSKNASLSPPSGEQQDFSSNLEYIVTAPNGAQRIYTVEILNSENSILSFNLSNGSAFSEAHISDLWGVVMIEVPNDFDVTTTVPEIAISKNASISPASGVQADLFAGETYIVTSQSGVERSYEVSLYTINQLKNPEGANNGSDWIFNGDSGIEEDPEHGTIFYLIADGGLEIQNINQTVEFSRDYSGKRILFMAETATEKVVEGSITRHPELQLYQNGNFGASNQLYLGAARHSETANVWQTIFNFHQLDPGVTGFDLRMRQAKQLGDDLDGTKSKYQNPEIRIFQSGLEARIYLEQIHSKN